MILDLTLMLSNGASSLTASWNTAMVPSPHPMTILSWKVLICYTPRVPSRMMLCRDLFFMLITKKSALLVPAIKYFWSTGLKAAQRNSLLFEPVLISSCFITPLAQSSSQMEISFSYKTEN